MSEDLKARFEHLLAGFESFKFTNEQIRFKRFSFEHARLDMESCLKCNGTICKTWVNRREKIDPRTRELSGYDYENQHGRKYYYALHPKACAVYKSPSFAVFKCPGVAVRKEQLFAIYRRVKLMHERDSIRTKKAVQICVES